MVFLTGADFRFKSIADIWIKHILNLGYGYIIYDLGDLGFGRKGFEETDLNFVTKGYYNSIGGSWKSTGLWKCRIIKDALEGTTDNIVYLDCDAFLIKHISISFESFDIGVVNREPNPDKDPLKIFLRGNYNAGVIFLSNNKRVKEFILQWEKKQLETKNDQAALSELLKTSDLRVKIFPSEYNSTKSSGFIYHRTGEFKNGKKIRRSVL